MSTGRPGAGRRGQGGVGREGGAAAWRSGLCLGSGAHGACLATGATVATAARYRHCCARPPHISAEQRLLALYAPMAPACLSLRDSISRVDVPLLRTLHVAYP